jgi:hypothetical protein
MAADQQPAKFQYTPIVQERHEIRIVVLLRGRLGDDIVCEVRHIFFDDSPSYEALSYTWGERTDPNQIILDGMPFMVTQNLALALRHLRLQDCDRHLWVDAICINQGDPDERNNQVKQMSRIYEAAKHVHVWLGPENEPSRIAMAFLRQVDAMVFRSMSSQSDEEEKEKLRGVHGWIKEHYDDPGNKGTWAAISRLWERNYWSRIWIIQEVVFGTTKRRQCIIHCGQDTIAWETLVALDRAMALIDKRCNDNEHSDVDIVQFSRGARLDLSWFIVTHGELSRRKELLLSYLLIRQGRYRATDLRDKVYALLSMAPESVAGGLVVNYKLSIAQVYAMAMREMVIRERKLGVLCSCCRECRRQGSLKQLPSWCPDFSTDPMDKCCPARLWSYTRPVYYASGEENAEAEFPLENAENDTPVVLVAKGWHLDTIKVLPLEDQYGTNGFLSPNCLLFMAEGIEGNYPQDLNSIDQVAHEAIWRTVVANRGQSHDIAPESFGEDYKTLLKMYLMSNNPAEQAAAQQVELNSSAEHVAVQQARRGDLAEYIAAQQFIPDNSAHYIPDQISIAVSNIEAKHATMPFKEMMATCLRKRRVCKSKTRFLPGLVPDTAQNGDIIGILVGCALPLVLRRVEDHFVVIGESYVHGFMSGEILDMESRGEIARRTFVIL